MLTAFNDKYSCPVIVNTSFNVRGEPIVCTPKDAYICFMRTEMDYLILNNYLLSKKEQIPLDKDSDWMSESNYRLIMIEEIKNIPSSNKDIKSFGITIGIMLFTISGFLMYLDNNAYQKYLDSFCNTFHSSRFYTSGIIKTNLFCLDDICCFPWLDNDN